MLVGPPGIASLVVTATDQIPPGAGFPDLLFWSSSIRQSKNERHENEEDPMRQRLIPVLLLLLVVVAVPAFAQKVYVDYDKEYDSSKIKTFAWANTPETSLEETNSLMHNRIVNAIEAQIAASGFQKVESDPDVWVTYHTSTSEELQISTDTWGYGYPGGWYPYSYRGSYWGRPSSSSGAAGRRASCRRSPRRRPPRSTRRFRRS
jgi:hypothetical protein